MDNKSEGYKMVATLGNSPMFAKDQDIRTVVAGQAVLQVPKGVFVAVDLETGKSIDSTQVATAQKIKMGVSNGKSIRWLPGVYGMNAKDMEGGAVSVPKAAVNEIVDNWFKCANCEDRYQAVVEVIDEDTISVMGDVDNGILYPADMTINCGGCEPDCNPEATCNMITPTLIAKLNSAAEKAIERKFYATPIYANDSFWCFEVDANGDFTTPITTFTIGGVTTTLSTPATNQDDLARVKAEIEQYVLDNNLNATVTVIGTHGMGVTGKPYILVNTDEGDFALAGYTACDTGTPTEGHDGECGFRIIGTLPKMDCDCEIQRVLRYKPRHIFVRNVSGFQDLVSTYLQKSEVAQNFGAELQILEYRQEVGGEGRGSNHSNVFNDTNFAISADPVSRLSTYSDGLVDCNKDYVKFHLNYIIPHRGSKGFGNTQGGISPNAYIAVPVDDTDTITSIKGFVNALLAVNGFSPLNEAGTVLEQISGENL